MSSSLLACGEVETLKPTYPQNLAVDSLFSEFTNETPGCAVAVDLDGKIIHSAAYGMGDFEQNIVLTPKSVFYAASVSKQVVAMVALLLNREGKIDLDTDIHTYIPEFQDYGTPLTVRHILYHISGIRDYFNLFRLGGRLDGMVITENKIMDLLAKQRALNFTPGEKWAYSNSAYFLISQVVKRVTGENMDDYAQTNIFVPLEMKNTRFQHNHLRPIRGKAHGHEKQANGEWLIADSLLDVVGSGGMYTTVEDLIKWDRNFYDNVLGTGQDMIDEMQTSGILNNGEPTEYGLALNLKPYKGLKRINHGGSLTGYRAMLQRFPDQKLSVALLCNSSEVNSGGLANSISDVYLSDLYQEEKIKVVEKAKTAAFVAPDGFDLSQYGGDYYNDEVENTIKVQLSEDGSGILSTAMDDSVWTLNKMDEFKHPLAPMFINYNRSKNGEVISLTYNGTRVMGLTFVKQLN
ncbi:MAG: serine hydrolase domain-containing protein [Sphingomonadales bacterium]